MDHIGKTQDFSRRSLTGRVTYEVLVTKRDGSCYE